MNAGGFAISHPSDGIGHVTDDLHIGHAVEKNVALRVQPAVRNAADGLGKRQDLTCEIEFQDVIVRYRWRSWGDWIGECCTRSGPAIWTKYQVEAGPGKSSRESRKHTQRRRDSGKLFLLLFEPAVLRLNVKVGWKNYECGRGFQKGFGSGKDNLSGHS